MRNYAHPLCIWLVDFTGEESCEHRGRIHYDIGQWQLNINIHSLTYSVEHATHFICLHRSSTVRSVDCLITVLGTAPNSRWELWWLCTEAVRVYQASIRSRQSHTRTQKAKDWKIVSGSHSAIIQSLTHSFLQSIVRRTAIIGSINFLCWADTSNPARLLER